VPKPVVGNAPLQKNIFAVIKTVGNCLWKLYWQIGLTINMLVIA